MRDKKRNIVLCNGLSAYKPSKEVLGGYLCEKVEQEKKDTSCPFLSPLLSKMVLDFFTTSSTMYLVGYDPRESLTGVIKNFLENKDILDLD